MNDIDPGLLYLTAYRSRERGHYMKVERGCDLGRQRSAGSPRPYLADVDPHRWLSPGQACQVRVLRYPVGTERTGTPRLLWIPARFLFWLRDGKALVAVYPHPTDPGSMRDLKPRPMLIDPAAPIYHNGSGQGAIRAFPVDKYNDRPRALKKSPEWVRRHGADEAA